MKQYNSLQNKNVNSISGCSHPENTSYYIIIVCVILFIIFVIIIKTHLSSVKTQLESCRSSCRSSII